MTTRNFNFFFLSCVGGIDSNVLRQHDIVELVSSSCSFSVFLLYIYIIVGTPSTCDDKTTAPTAPTAPSPPTTYERTYLDLRANLFDVSRNSRHEPPSPAAAEDNVQGLAVALLKNFHADRALPRDNLAYGRVHRWIDQSTDGRVNGWMDRRWLDGSMNEWVHGIVYGSMDCVACTYALALLNVCVYARCVAPAVVVEFHRVVYIRPGLMQYIANVPDAFW